MDRFELAFDAGDEIRALAYLALGQLDQAERLVRMNVERAATGQIGGQVADSVLLLAALADAEGDRAVATDLLLQMGVGNHAGTRMFSADLAVRLGVPEEHAAGVRRAITFHGSGAAAANTVTRAARGARSPRLELSRPDTQASARRWMILLAGGPMFPTVPDDLDHHRPQSSTSRDRQVPPTKMNGITKRPQASCYPAVAGLYHRHSTVHAGNGLRHANSP